MKQEHSKSREFEFEPVLVHVLGTRKVGPSVFWVVLIVYTQELREIYPGSARITPRRRERGWVRDEPGMGPVGSRDGQNSLLI